MTPQEKAEELIYKFAQTIPPSSYLAFEEGVQINFDLENAKQCAIIAVNYIINSNPHSNPFNTDIYSTMDYWLQVKTELEKL